MKKVTEPQQLEQIIQNVFCKVPVKLKEQNQLHNIKVLGYQNKVLDIVLAQPAGAPVRVLVVNHKDYWMLLECQVLESPAQNHERLKPLRLHLKRQIRKETRYDVQDSGPIVQNCIPVKLIPEKLYLDDKQRDALLKIFQDKLEVEYYQVEVILRQSMRMEHRLRIMERVKAPIYAPDRNSMKGWQGGDTVPYPEYEKIKGYDDFPDKLRSEISVPLLYRKTVIWGYIRVMNIKELTTDDLKKIKAVGASLEKEFEARGFLPRAAEKLGVVDISQHGLGFRHPKNQLLSRHFRPGEPLILDLLFPEDGKNMFLTGNIRNMKIAGDEYRIGLEFKDIDADQFTILEDYIKRTEHS